MVSSPARRHGKRSDQKLKFRANCPEDLGARLLGRIESRVEFRFARWLILLLCYTPLAAGPKTDQFEKGCVLKVTAKSLCNGAEREANRRTLCERYYASEPKV
jgi:hypothetical protein